MPNEIQAVTAQNEITQQLLMDYLKQTNSNLLPNEQAQFVAIASAFGLNPWKREIYAVAYGQGEKRKLSIIVGYETYLRRAEAFPQYDGYDTEFTREDNTIACTCRVHRKDRSRPTVAKVFLNEYHQGNTMWNTKPKVMLEKVAICTALRRAFPEDMGGMPYAEDELPDSMTGAEKLQQQGMTEVKAEAPAKSKKTEFKEKLAALGKKNPEAFRHLGEMIKAQGWNNSNDIPEDRHAEVLGWWKECEQAAQIENIGNDSDTTEAQEVENG